MCNLYSITTNQDAIRRLFGVTADSAGNLSSMPGVFPDYEAPVVRAQNGQRELIKMRWGMPAPLRTGFAIPHHLTGAAGCSQKAAAWFPSTALPSNHPRLWWFFNKVKRLWLASLKRRSQTARLSWERFIPLVARFFPPIRTIHPLPCHRFDAKTRGRSPVR